MVWRDDGGRHSLPAKYGGKQFRRKMEKFCELDAPPPPLSVKVNGKCKVHEAGQMPGSAAALCSEIA